MAQKLSYLEGFKAVDSLPKTLRGWAANALNEFIETGNKMMQCDFKDAKEANNKYTSFNNARKRYDMFQDKVAVHKYGTTVVLERTDI